VPRSFSFRLLTAIVCILVVAFALGMGLGHGHLLLLAAVFALLAILAAVWVMNLRLRKALLPLQKFIAGLEKHDFTTRVDYTQFSELDGLVYRLNRLAAKTELRLKRLTEERQNLSTWLDSMQAAVVAVDAAGRVQWANIRMQDIAEGAVRTGHALVQTLRDPEVLECVRVALEERSVCERKSSTLMMGRTFEVTAAPTPGGGAVLVLHEITQIEQVEKTQRDFIANVSHELRTPLTSISGYVETLLDHKAEVGPEGREFLGIILKNANRMPVPAVRLIEDAMAAMRGLLRENDVLLEMGEITSQLVMASPDAMQQVLTNLIENAIRYGKPRTGHARIIVSALELGAEVEFSVQDFGQGIPSDHLGRIFERFYRVDKTRSRESGGTGLGLAIVRHIVQMHGGSIRAESELNAGSTFYFTLPLAVAAVSV
jgi:two-component system phosphate regulon sensor histidine kinase PhoR